MPQVGVRELKAHASEIIREVWERRARYVITYRGRPVCLLLPWDEASPALVPWNEELGADAWEALKRLGEEIGREWRSPRTSSELLSEMRR